MISTLYRTTNKGIYLLIGFHLGTRLDLFSAITIECRLMNNLPGQAHTGAKAFDIILVLQIVETYLWMPVRIAALYPDPSPALGLIVADMHLKTIAIKGFPAVITHGGGQEVILEIRCGQARLGADKTAGFKMVGRPKSRLGKEPAAADQELVPPIQFAVEGNWLGATELKIELQMILKILPHPGKACSSSIPASLRTSGAPIPESCSRWGEPQDLLKDHFAAHANHGLLQLAAAFIAHPGCHLVLQQYLVHQCAGHHF